MSINTSYNDVLEEKYLQNEKLSLTENIYKELDLPQNKKLDLIVMISDLDIKIRHRLIKNPNIDFRLSTAKIIKAWCQMILMNNFTNSDRMKVDEYVNSWISDIELEQMHDRR